MRYSSAICLEKVLNEFAAPRSVPASPVTEPVAWCHERSNGGRVFYTSLGGPGDFENPIYRRLLTNAILWTTRQTEDKIKR